MKKALAALILLVLTVASISAQETVDVVYLIDGQVITGKIIETEKYPEHRIKIQTEDGTVYIVKMADVEKIVEQTAPVFDSITHLVGAEIAGETNGILHRDHISPHLDASFTFRCEGAT